jgi:hypothetical protein
VQQPALLIGLVAGVTWIILAFFPTECAPPTESSEVFCNRLWTPALAGMLTGFSALFVRIRSLLSRAAILGFAGLLVGFVLMVAGNFSEYWFLNDLPHAGPDGRIRAVAFMTQLFGFLLVLTGASVCGIASFRGARAPRLMGLLFTSLLPLTLILGAVSQSWVGLSLGGVSVAASALGLLRESSSAQDPHDELPRA